MILFSLIGEVKEAVEAFGGADDNVKTLDRTIAYLTASFHSDSVRQIC
ncbi:MAG: hypothetical protein JXM70_16390 [Pirellulales bacterium]|nr:hypothetical protein [Pirellulales bacterium]